MKMFLHSIILTILLFTWISMVSCQMTLNKAGQEVPCIEEFSMNFDDICVGVLLEPEDKGQFICYLKEKFNHTCTSSNQCQTIGDWRDFVFQKPDVDHCDGIPLGDFDHNMVGEYWCFTRSKGWISIYVGFCRNATKEQFTTTEATSATIVVEGSRERNFNLNPLWWKILVPCLGLFCGVLLLFRLYKYKKNRDQRRHHTDEELGQEEALNNNRGGDEQTP